MLGTFVNSPVAPPWPQAQAACLVQPEQYPAPVTYGQGVWVAPQRVVLYARPPKPNASAAGAGAAAALENDTKPVDVLLWSPQQDGPLVYSEAQHRYLPAQRYFVQFEPARNIALMAVVSDEESPDGQLWLEVVIGQDTPAVPAAGATTSLASVAASPRPKTAWVPAQLPKETANPMGLRLSRFPWPPGTYLTWLTYLSTLGRQNGFTWLAGVPERDRSLHMAPEDHAKLLSSTFIRRQQLKHVRGNWMLIEALDFERTPLIGWARWRDENGSLMALPRLSPAPAGY
jgi:hypothetical protein